VRKSKSLARLRAGQIVRNAVVSHFSPRFVGLAARAGYDSVWVDLEHNGMPYREVQSLLAHFHLFDIDCILRVPTLEKTQLYRYLEDGATGIMIPNVATAERARQIVEAVKFPPLGDRGLDNAGLDSRYRQNPDPIAYTQWANSETFLMLQIETPEGVANSEAIAAVEGVDFLFVGPGDLGLRLKLAGDHDGSQLEAAFEHIAAACKRQGKAWGCPAGTVEEMRRRAAQGAQFLTNFGDFACIQDGLRNGIKDFDLMAKL